MAKNVLYRYNPETDNFERIYPSLKSRLVSFCKVGGIAAGLAVGIFILIFYCFDSPTEENLRKENSRLRLQYRILDKRLENSLKVIQRIQDRDDNFYRVMMQMEPLSAHQRYAGLDNEGRYKELEDMTDADLIKRMARNIDILERQVSAQVTSFDQLRENLGMQQERLQHTPSILPVKLSRSNLASGYGYRLDPVNGAAKFHEGLDFAAPEGSPVYATADGVVKVAERTMGYGNSIDIDHGFNYTSRYAHLSEMTVAQGEEVRRGQLIGRVGSTGKSTTPHLHYEVRFKDDPMNPVNYFFNELSAEDYVEMLQMAENAGHVMD